MFMSYRALLARAGAPPLALACALGWLAFDGYSLAVLLAVHAASGSFSEAGAALAAFAAGSGIVAPFRGRLVDRRGPRGLAAFAVGHGLAAASLVVCCTLGVGTPLLLATSALTGALAPPLIATARVIWGSVAGDLALTAYAMNGVLGDVGQLAGPALAGTAAAVLSPAGGFGVLAGFASAAALFVGIRADHLLPAVTQRDCAQEREPGASESDPCVRASVPGIRRNGSGALTSPGFRTLVVGDVGLALAGGALDVAVTAMCARLATPEWAALPLASAAAGSVLASLWSGTGQLRRTAAWRYLTGCWLAATPLTLLLASASIAEAACAMAASGIGFGLLGVALYELLDDIVPAERSVEAFTWLTAAQAAGVAVGSTLAGQLSRTSTGVTFALVSGAALVTALVVSARHASLTRRASL